jgi:hypothetical protein
MTVENKQALVRERLSRLAESPKNIKCPGVVRKLKRKVRNFDK